VNPVVSCQHCGHLFEVDQALVGGYTNCPQCGKATSVEGLRDPLWRMWQVGVVAAVVVAAGITGAASGPAPAIGVLVGGLALAWLVSRAF